MSTNSCFSCTDPWGWVALYTDGTVMRECDGDGSPHRGFAEVDTSRLSKLSWEPIASGLPRLIHSYDQDGEPVLFRRRYVAAVDFGSGMGNVPNTLHCLGVERLVSGATVGEYQFMFPDGRVETTNDRNAY